VRSAAQCRGLRECGPHISRIERRRGSLAAMGKGRDGAVFQEMRREAVPQDMNAHPLVDTGGRARRTASGVRDVGLDRFVPERNFEVIAGKVLNLDGSQSCWFC